MAGGASVYHCLLRSRLKFGCCDWIRLSQTFFEVIKRLLRAQILVGICNQWGMQSVGYAISGVCQTISQSQLVIVNHSHESKVIMNLVTVSFRLS